MGNDAILDEFIGSDTNVMVAAALRILARMADDEVERRLVVAPWAWDLRQRARKFELQGNAACAARAKVIARMVSAVALGEIGGPALLAAACRLDVDTSEVSAAVYVLELAMRQELEVSA